MTRRDAGLVAYRAASDVAGKAAFLLITIVAARRLPTDAFGVFALGSTLGWMTAVLADFGIQMHLARAVARDPAGAASLLRVWFVARLQLAMAVLLLTTAGLWAIGLPAYAAALVVFVLVYQVNGLIEFLYYFYRGLGRSDLESTLTLAQRLLTLVSASAVLIWRPDPVALALAMLWPAAGALFISARYALRLAPHAPAAAPRVAHTNGLVPRAFWPEVAPIGLGIALSALYFRIDVVLIETWNGLEALALYTAVFRLVEALRLFPAAVLAVALPALCRSTTSRPVLPLAAGLSAAAAAASVVLWMAAGWLVPFVYGEPYAAAVPVFRILLLAFPLMSLNYALTQQVIAWDRHRAYAALCAMALAVNVGLNARLIPAWSIAGAAWTTVWTEALLTLGCLVVLVRHLRHLADSRLEAGGHLEGVADRPALTPS